MSPLSPVTRLAEMQRRGRHKFQVFILALCLAQGLPLALGLTPGPATLESALHPAIVQVWGLSLVLGSIAALVGPRRNKVPGGLIIEEVGLALAGIPSFIYAFILVWSVGFVKGGLASAFILGFALAALGRYREIFNFLKELGELVEKKTE